MNIEVTPIERLSGNDRQRWIALLAAGPEFANPFLHPGFAETASRILTPVDVALFRDGEQFGVLPVVRGRNAAAPPAEGLNEQQALVATPGLELSPHRLLRTLGVSSLRFDHLLDAQRNELGLWTSRRGGSPQADLSAGFEAYVEQRKAAGSSTIRETLRKERKLQREVGAVEFQLHDADEATFEKLIGWKRQQHHRTGVDDLFADSRVVELLREIRLLDEPGFRARFSVLRANGEPLAVHLGLFSDSVGHVWYPAYDTRFSSYSPGLILLLRMMRAISEQGCRTLDFGPGPQRYKRSLQTHSLPICMGVVDASGLVSLARRGWHGAKTFAKSLPLQQLGNLVPFASFRKATSHA